MTTPRFPAPFPYQRIRFVAQVEHPIELPPFAGSALRGVFGHSLRKLACATGAPTCDGCPLRHQCAYERIFEPSPPDRARRQYRQIPAAFVLTPPDTQGRLATGAQLEFGVTLIGSAIKQRDLLIAAWQRALLAGLGPTRGTARLTKCHEDAPLLQPDEHATQLTLQFQTPLFLKRQGKQLNPNEITASEITTALVRRIADLAELQLGWPLDWDFPALTQAARSIDTRNSTLSWASNSRWSNRQQQHMELRGAVGHITLSGKLQPFIELLTLGQALHIGGKTSFGLGRYCITQ
ncbi:CRISPR system precrRNA processing endoribonuclease RAMP protein Cas6 [Niveibacterium sp. 24ML]|uniref:CRISPR system precrRNA processing endoribonuclease RAMP protein Cas6 n=1 Tax=Niveibacterium sp. 24ML TaxID=2985512 RepID=UPI00226ED7CA|nr:CRISPR system precrRNA processing endoribonuclease RAMP protein Cas6 [Niveibacterium sp. 24ML]MCX9157920.1 CRISPR system precrRNA processing endoribonuclease RAMP protein Cas6 [Niveibacterium sp. 24ML]